MLWCGCLSWTRKIWSHNLLFESQVGLFVILHRQTVAHKIGNVCGQQLTPRIDMQRLCITQAISGRDAIWGWLQAVWDYPFPWIWRWPAQRRSEGVPDSMVQGGATLRFPWIFIALQALYTATIKQPMSFLFTDVPGRPQCCWVDLKRRMNSSLMLDTNLRLMLWKKDSWSILDETKQCCRCEFLYSSKILLTPWKVHQQHPHCRYGTSIVPRWWKGAIGRSNSGKVRHRDIGIEESSWLQSCVYVQGTWRGRVRDRYVGLCLWSHILSMSTMHHRSSPN